MYQHAPGKKRYNSESEYGIWQTSTFVSNMLGKTARMLCIVGSFEVISNSCISVCCKVNHSLCQSANWTILGKNMLQQRENGYSEPKVIVNNRNTMHRKRRVPWFAQYSCCDAVSNVNYRAPAWNGDGTRWRWCHDKNGMLKWTSASCWSYKEPRVAFQLMESSEER